MELETSSSSSSSSSQSEEQSWISWLCAVPGNNFLCEVDKAFIEDSFNLYGLKQLVPNHYNDAIKLMLDRSEDAEESSSEIFRSSEVLYGLIHARFILSGAGLMAMHKKFLRKDFGECPRTCCEGQAVLPIGISEEIGAMPVKLFCPRCRDLFNAPSAHNHVDGAYFGSSFSHLFLMTFDEVVPPAPTSQFVPRIFGFKIHHSSSSLPKPPPAKAGPTKRSSGTITEGDKNEMGSDKDARSIEAKRSRKG